MYEWIGFANDGIACIVRNGKLPIVQQTTTFGNFSRLHFHSIQGFDWKNGDAGESRFDQKRCAFIFALLAGAMAVI